MRGPRFLTAVFPVALLLGAALAGQSARPSVRIASPAQDAYVTGVLRLVALVEPAPAARQVTEVAFFADGRHVCTVARPPFECEWDAGEGVTEHQIRAVATLRNGERLVHTTRTRGIAVAERVDVDVVQVTAVVTDGDGRFVRGLQEGDFKVYEDGRPQPITHFASEQIPLELVAAIDVSASMHDVLDQVKVAARRFLEGIGEQDQVTVLAFNENIFTLARRETDQAVRARAIGRMASWGGTALYDVIARAVEILGRQAGRRAIVLFSDGDDQSSHTPLASAIRATEGSDATIYVIGQGRAVANASLQELMRRLATVSGGRAFFTEDPARLDAVFAEILEDLRNQYLLAYPAPATQRDGAWHSIRVEVAGGKYQVRARQGYRLAKPGNGPS